MKITLTTGRAQLWEGCRTKADPFFVMAHDQLNISSYCDTVVKKASVVQVCVRKQIFKDERSYSVLLFCQLCDEWSSSA